MSQAPSARYWKGALAVAGALAVFGCGSNAFATDPVTDPAAPAPSLSQGGGNGHHGGRRIDRCKPQQSEKVTDRIGIVGGTIRFGRNQITIPPGALSKTVTITAEVVADSTNSVRFEPHGLVFARAVILKLRYDGCTQSSAGTHEIVYTDDNLNVLEEPFSIDRVTDRSVEGEIWHFSRYAVAW
ncbi:MAG: hypothetical protein ABI647_02665 [Gemmatimonadota bacterium]